MSESYIFVCVCTCVPVHSCVYMCAFMCAHDYMNYVSVGGDVTTFGCGMYVELISCFHICSIMIKASEWDPVHLFVSTGNTKHILTLLCGVSQGTWSAVDTTWGEGKRIHVLGGGLLVFMFCKLRTQDKLSACDQTVLYQYSLDADTSRKHCKCTVLFSE